ncbi:peptidoglycan DD-metalloendopeptidase family protein [Halomonas koreensis]|uniref:Peptidoglycan DD-metalloendopeptidase family protein n=1 Tax=Halomonas koreensis TaxID=245385 RepID=A0ABU1G6Q7_9GAMM|nr:peptidoglycan DD-metalloendopeptidase family protein [Halomonas koreensis]MDR5868631.1 peptidoglycan DD-metalloendopeptidase family protein [Halomonas koreensis]
MPLLGLALAGGAAAADDARQARARLDAIGERIEAVTADLAATRDARDEAGEALREIETALAETHARLDAIQAQRRTLRREIAALEERRATLEAERRDQRAALAEQLAALYRLGLTPQLKLLLNQDDPARLDRLQTYLNRLAEARHARLDALARLDAELADNRRALDRRGERLATLSERLERRSAELADRVARREALVAELEDRYASEQARLADLDQDRAHAERVLRQVQSRLARLQRPPPSTEIEATRGELPWPVQGKVTSGFGGGDGVHRNGLVIRAAEGREVTAVHAGRVVFADWMRGFGNLLIVDHGDGVMTLHAHLQRFSARVGQAVARGDPLGRVGATGGQPRPGLYFEVRRGGDPIDPRGWIARR